MLLNRANVAAGYADLMGRYALPLFHTQTFASRAHPETVEKALRYYVNRWNDELHGNNWKRRGVDGVQYIAGIERHKSGNPHSHAVLGHPDIDLGSAEHSALRRSMRELAEHEWGFAKLEVAKSPEHTNAYISKYVSKDGDIVISSKIENLATGQLSLMAVA